METLQICPKCRRTPHLAIHADFFGSEFYTKCPGPCGMFGGLPKKSQDKAIRDWNRVATLRSLAWWYRHETLLGPRIDTRTGHLYLCKNLDGEILGIHPGDGIPERAWQVAAMPGFGLVE